MSIPDKAVDAAWEALSESRYHLRSPTRSDLEAALEAAAPHMLAGLDRDIAGELQDAEPSNYEEDNYDAGYIAGLSYALDKLRATYRPTP